MNASFVHGFLLSSVIWMVLVGIGFYRYKNSQTPMAKFVAVNSYRDGNLEVILKKMPLPDMNPRLVITLFIGQEEYAIHDYDNVKGKEILEILKGKIRKAVRLAKKNGIGLAVNGVIPSRKYLLHRALSELETAYASS